MARHVTVFSTITAAVLAALFAAGASVLPELFTCDRSVLGAISVPWWFLVGQLIIGGIVFALEVVLLGAGDAAFLRTATLVSALVGFLPLVWLSLQSVNALMVFVLKSWDWRILAILGAELLAGMDHFE